MKDENEKWVEDVLGSFKGSTKAQPNPDLFSRISTRLNENAKVIPIWKWNIAKAAALIVLILNIFAISNFMNTDNGVNSEYVNNEKESIMSNYELYEL